MAGTQIGDGEGALSPTLAPSEPFDRTGSDLAGGKFTLVRQLGRGGMGEVYVARHNTLGKELAIKVLARRFSSNPLHVERFVQEARAASAIAHENVIEVTDFGSTPDGSAFMAMELLDGESLAATLRNDGPRLPWTRVKRIILQVCRALHAAHTRGVFHRDMKPDNCFRTRRGGNRDYIKVLDFGLAKIVGDETNPQQSITQTGSVFGTPEYMSPEQALGKRSDHRSDIYSVGVMLYQMMTGTLPFEGKTALSLLTKHAMEAPEAPSRRHPIPPAIEAVILRAMEKDPAQRFGSMREMAEAIVAIPVDAPAAEPAPPPPVQTYRGVAIALGILSAVLAVALVASLMR